MLCRGYTTGADGTRLSVPASHLSDIADGARVTAMMARREANTDGAVRPLGLFRRITGAAADEHSWIALAEQQRGELPAEVPGPLLRGVRRSASAAPPGRLMVGRVHC